MAYMMIPLTVGVHRTDRVELSRPLLYDDSVDDVFEREPYSILVRSLLTGNVYA